MRIVIRLVLVLAVLLAAAALIVVLWRLGPTEPSGWATVAAALAVLTSVIGSWTAQRVLELEEDKQRPFPHLRFDLGSRDNLLLLRLTNSGGSAAFSLSILWDQPGLQIHQSIPHGGREAHFSLSQPEVPVLLPGESVALAIATPSIFFASTTQVYTGAILFKTSAGRLISSSFKLSADHYRFALSHETEDLITHRRLQELPKQLKDIADAVKSCSDPSRGAA